MPGGRHENMQAWSPEEDQIILAMVASEGPKWSKIVQRLPGRTVSSVRNRWQRIEKGRKLREAGIESKNRCHACGLPKRGHVCTAKLGGGPKVAVDPVLSGMNAVPLVPPIVGRNPIATFEPPPNAPGIRRTRSGSQNIDMVAQLLARTGEAIGTSSVWADQPPMVQRSNTGGNNSFFAGLTEFAFNDTADDGAQRNKLFAEMASKTDGNVPPSIARRISGDGSAPVGPPKMTRSVSSFIREFETAVPAAGGAGPSAPAVNQRASSANLLSGGLASLNNVSFSNFSFGSTSFGPGIASLASQQPFDLPANLGQDFTGSVRRAPATPPPLPPPPPLCTAHVRRPLCPTRLSPTLTHVRVAGGTRAGA